MWKGPYYAGDSESVDVYATGEGCAGDKPVGRCDIRVTSTKLQVTFSPFEGFWAEGTHVVAYGGTAGSSRTKSRSGYGAGTLKMPIDGLQPSFVAFDATVVAQQLRAPPPVELPEPPSEESPPSEPKGRKKKGGLRGE